MNIEKRKEKKIMKKLLCVCVALILVLSGMSVFAANSTENMTVQDRENEAIIKYNDLLDEWTDGIDADGNINIAYPDYYGGAYIDDDKNLVILVTNEIETAKQKLSTIIDLAGVEFENVTYSFNQLREVQEEIKSDVETSNGLGKGVTGIGLSIKENVVTVYSENNSPKKVLRNVIGQENTKLYDCVKIIIREGRDTPALAVEPGTGIANRSVGFWAIDHKTKNEGIVTAPHDQIPKGTLIYIDEAPFGHSGRPYYSGNLDAVFIPCANPNFTATREIPGFRFSLKNKSLALPVGSTIYARGITSGYMVGKVKDTDYTTSYGISDTVLTDAISGEGDSGGIVAGGGTPAERYVAGIITGYSTPNPKSKTGELVYVKAANILTKLNLTLY